MGNTISPSLCSTKLYGIVWYNYIALHYISFVSKETNDLKCPSGLLGVDHYTT